MNKKQIFFRTLKAAVLISAVSAILPVYVYASYDLGSFSGTFSRVCDSNGNNCESTPKEFWHTLTITHSGKLVLNFTYTDTGSSGFGACGVYFYKPDKSSLLSFALLSYNSLTVSDNIAPGTYYIRASVGAYGTYTIQAAFTNADDNITESEPNDTIDAANPFTNNQITGVIGYTDGINTDTRDWFRYEVTHSGKLVLNFTGSSGLGSCGVYLYKPDKSDLSFALLSYNSLTVSNIAPGTYYIQVGCSAYGTYTIQADMSVPVLGLQDAIVCLRILSGIPVSSSDMIITDINKDGRIGLEEVIYSLQVVAGLRTQ